MRNRPQRPIPLGERAKLSLRQTQQTSYMKHTFISELFPLIENTRLFLGFSG